MAKKIVVIGAGSDAFTPGLISDAILSKDLAGSTLTLFDIDPDRCEIMYELGQRMVREAGADLKIEQVDDRASALKGADFVISVIMVGGLEAWKRDIDIPLKYGIYQSVGDSVNPGGIFRAFRTIPVLIEICQEMERVCPNAWLFNYTNPMSFICLALNRATRIKTAGFCHGIFGTVRLLADFLGFCVEEISVQAAGVNHLTWLLDFRLRGEDAYPLLREKLSRCEEVAFPVSAELFKIYGLFPSPGDRHVAEFFPYFLNKETGGGKKYRLQVNDVDARMRGKSDNLKRLVAQANGEIPLGETRASGERAVAAASAIANNKNEMHVVNIPNKGYISNLPDDVLVEVHALVGAYGMRGINVGNLPEGIASFMQNIVAQQRLVVEAALTGDKEIALQAILADALVNSIDDARKMMAELFEVHAEYLPQFCS